MVVATLYRKIPLLLPLLQEDDAELAKKLAALKWHGKELEVRCLLLAVVFMVIISMCSFCTPCPDLFLCMMHDTTLNS